MVQVLDKHSTHKEIDNATYNEKENEKDKDKDKDFSG